MASLGHNELMKVDISSDIPPQKVSTLVPTVSTAVFKIRSETCRTEAQFCENLYMIKKESLPNLAGPTQILPVNVRGPALILKTATDALDLMVLGHQEPQG